MNISDEEIEKMAMQNTESIYPDEDSDGHTEYLAQHLDRAFIDGFKKAQEIYLIEVQRRTRILKLVKDFRLYIECVDRPDGDDQEEQFLIKQLNELFPEGV